MRVRSDDQGSWHLKFLIFLSCLVACLVLVGIAATPRVFVWSARSTLVTMAGQTVVVTCRVAQDERNRGLFLGIRDYTSSYHQLDGERAAITHRADFHKVPCDAGALFCELVDQYENRIMAQQPLTVAGCDGP